MVFVCLFFHLYHNHSGDTGTEPEGLDKFEQWK